jgi:MoaA/NifB/PqqE/SkfB family radical SAM enzyme
VNLLSADHTFAQRSNYIRYRFAKKAEVLRYDPVTISIVATTRCTLSCDMCPTHSSVVPRDYPHIQKNTKDMDFGMFKEIIDRFHKALTVHIIGSGEPLLNKDFFRMVDYAASRNMVVKTFSNGTTIEANMDAILDSRLDGITISVNGHDSGEFKRMTGMPEEVYAGIREATARLVEEKKRKSSKVKVKISFIIDRHNYRHIPRMVDVGLRLGVDHIFFCNFLPSPYKGLRAEERMLKAGDKFASELKEIFGVYPPQIRKKLTPPVLLDARPERKTCATHFSQIRFDGDGNVSSCSMMLLDMTGHGSYDEDGVWNNEFFRKMRGIFLSQDHAILPEPCRVCPDNKGLHIV